MRAERPQKEHLLRWFDASGVSYVRLLNN